MAGKRRFGRIRQLSSGRWQARYTGPDGVERPAPNTFARKAEADRWLASKESELLSGPWTAPERGAVLLKGYGSSWLRERPGLRPKTRQLYEGLLRLHLNPSLGESGLGEITPARVRTWRASLLAAGVGPVTVAKSYRLLRTILETAVEDQLIRSNPCRIRGAAVERSPERKTLTVHQVQALANGVHQRHRLLVLLATFGCLRWGELAALTRKDLDVEGGWIHVRNTLVELADGSLTIGPPKTDAGRRVVAVPQLLVPEIRAHLSAFVGSEPSSFVFVGPKGGLLRRSNFQRHWLAALKSAGLQGTHFHDLRHTGNTLAAQSGATLADLMARMGHSSTKAALIYLHTNSTRDRTVAASLEELLLRTMAEDGHPKDDPEDPPAAVPVGA